MKTFCFVFARGGSKGLPGKNIKKLQGKPLIAYSIDVALACPSIADVFVSTDDAAIASVAKAAGATVIDRPTELADDRAPEWLAWQHAVDWVHCSYGDFDEFVSLPATSPLRSLADVQNAIDQYRRSPADACICITPANRSPYFNMVKQQGEYVTLVNEPKQALIARRQDAPVVYDITTVAYVTSPAFIQQSTGLFAGKLTSVMVPKERAVDIDDLYDFRFAETLLKDAVKTP